MTQIDKDAQELENRLKGKFNAKITLRVIGDKICITFGEAAELNAEGFVFLKEEAMLKGYDLTEDKDWVEGEKISRHTFYYVLDVSSPPF